jgi:thymidylate kinase/8-oxo-dGTP pyrophosphatase MutT (NUDIX family)
MNQTMIIKFFKKSLLSYFLVFSFYLKENITDYDQKIDKYDHELRVKNIFIYFYIYMIMIILIYLFVYYLSKYHNKKCYREYVNILVYNNLGEVLISKRLYEPNKNCYLVPGGKKEITDISLKYVAVRELYEETGLEVNNELKYCFAYKTGKYIVHYFSLYLNDDQEAITKEPEKHEEWFWTNRFYEYKLAPSLEYFKIEVMNIIKPRYIVISGSTGVGKTTIIKRLNDKIKEKGYEVKTSTNSILDGYDHIKQFLREYKETGNQDKIMLFEYSLLNIYNKRREEILNSKEDFIIVDREICDGDIYKLCYGWSEEKIRKEQVKISIPMINFVINCKEDRIKHFYNQRKIEEHKFSYEEYIKFSNMYNEKFIMLANQKAIEIKNDSTIEKCVNEIFEYIKPFLIKI